VNAFDPALFSASIGCLPCCAAPGECACALEIPIFSSPFPSYADAEAIVSDPLAVAGCIFFQQSSTGTLSSLTATDDGTDISISAAYSSPASDLDGWLSITAATGTTISVAYTGGTTGRVEVYDCEGNLLETVTGSSPIVTSGLPEDSTYYIRIVVGVNPGDPPFSAATITVTPSATYTINPVIALWDDSGTTRRLEACPKMLVPLLTESTGLWYANCADAATDLATDAVSNCVGICTTTITTFTATDGGTSLSFAATSPPSTSMDFWGSVNAEVGETLSFAWTDFPNATVNIYDYTGTLVETLTGSSSPLVSSALPYTGRYTVNVLIFVPPPGGPLTSGSAAVTSSGAMTVNQIQALYDAGLTCPGRLNCGDSCP
jgi:hypothetical protein